jgi:hypothetical protein
MPEPELQKLAESHFDHIGTPQERWRFPQIQSAHGDIPLLTKHSLPLTNEG